MGEHRLRTTTVDIQVSPPAHGQFLVGNCVGAWEPCFLMDVYEPFGEPPAISAALTTLTVTDPTVADYAIQDVTNTAPYGFVDAEEARTVLAVLRNLQVRVAELEARLRAVQIVE